VVVPSHQSVRAYRGNDDVTESSEAQDMFMRIVEPHGKGRVARSVQKTDDYHTYMGSRGCFYRCLRINVVNFTTFQ
jgi:hypothetical protein